MRITDSSLDLASSHAVSASLEGRRTVSAWDRTGRVDLSQDVKVTLSGADAASALAAQARAMTGNGHGLNAPRAVRLAVPQASPQAQARAAAASAVQASDAPAAGVADDYTVDPEELARSAWLLLLRLTGNEDAAAALATRLAEFAQQVEPKSEAAAAVRQAAARYAAGVGSPGEAPPPPPQDWGYREDVSVSVTEAEQTSFAAAGTVQTADGRTITIAAAFSLVRQQTVSLSASLRLGAAARDPLVLSMTAKAPGLASGTQQVDVDNDGDTETVAALDADTRYLVRDLNGNGTVDGGSEMFGPATDNGFAELAALDGDGNGWVDEGDAAFAQMALWSGNEGDALVGLKQAGVGALAAQAVATQYQYGAQTGTLAASSVYLREDGTAGISGEVKLYA